MDKLETSTNHLDESMTARRSDPRKPKNKFQLSTRYLLRTKLRSHPSMERLILRYWRPVKFIYWKTRWGVEAYLRSLQGEQVRYIDGDRIYPVSPDSIIYSSLQEFDLKHYKGRILSGNWDRLEKRFEDLDLFQAIKEVCVENKKWRDTVFFQRMLNDINQGRTHYGCHYESDLVNHCQNIESLFNEIQSHGYKSQKSLFSEGKVFDPLKADEEIALCIGRDGDLLFSDGAHRLAIAKLLKLPSIPIKVTVRHTEWIAFREKLVLYARDSNNSKDNMLYQPATHLDLTDIPAIHESENRFQVIRDNSSFTSGNLLDIGACLGYFCHRFEDLGFTCHAIENDAQTAYFLTRLARTQNRRFKIYTDSVLENTEIREIHFNIVIALNIFHHFLKNQNDYECLVNLLHTLEMDEMYFEPQLPGETQMESAYMNYSPEEFVQFIITHSILDHYKLVGTMGDCRPIYKLYRAS
jgi:2-polyprenyl-3-methyl-5-hydroxy-6-metoxy-1,4-benzoquinol methylase